MRNLKTKYLTTIYRDVLNKKPVSEIHKALKELTINGDKRLLNLAIKVANKAKARDQKQPQDQLALSFVLLFTKFAYNYKANLIINERTREDDDKHKQELLEVMLKNNDKPFYMASWHKDSAEDHKDWQGKLYYDANATGEALEYAKSHGLRTLQWVTGKPVYFVTRPYCRHYFVQYSLEEVKQGVKPRTRKVGDRRLQTPAMANMDYYKDRLEQYEALYRVFPIPKLKDMINKTKLLIKKWKGEI